MHIGYHTYINLLLYVYFAALQRQRDGDDDSDDEDYIGSLFELRKIRTFHMRRFNTQAREYTLQIKDETFPDDISVDESMTRVYYVLKGVIKKY